MWNWKRRSTSSVTRDFGRFAFNTAVAAVMELVNECYAHRDDPNVGFAVATAGALIFPSAPHLGAEVYERMTGRRVWEDPWPVADPDLVVGETVEVVVQVNGKVRDRFEVDAGLSEDELVAQARASERVRSYLDGGEPRKTIVVPKKLVNFVV